MNICIILALSPEGSRTHFFAHASFCTHPQLVVELADVRIIALGVLNKPRGTTMLNPNARTFLHPPGIEKDEIGDGSRDNMGMEPELGSSGGGGGSGSSVRARSVAGAWLLPLNGYYSSEVALLFVS